jgi:hypothetical protein
MSLTFHIVSRLNRSLRRRSAVLLAPAFIIAIGAPSGAHAVDSAFFRSLLLPGSGQAHRGHYTKATVFAGLTILSGAGLFASQIQYNRSVDDFSASKTAYEELADDLDNGNIVSSEDIDAAYNGMTAADDEAAYRLKWRNAFAAILATTYVVNLVDVLVSKPHDPETALRLDVTPERVLLSKGFRF